MPIDSGLLRHCSEYFPVFLLSGLLRALYPLAQKDGWSTQYWTRATNGYWILPRERCQSMHLKWLSCVGNPNLSSFNGWGVTCFKWPGFAQKEVLNSSFSVSISSHFLVCSVRFDPICTTREKRMKNMKRCFIG